MKSIFVLTLIFLSSLSCTTTGNKMITVSNVNIDKFMGNWYVLAGRFTFLEVDVHNGLETYTWNKEEQRIDVGFTFNKGSFSGPIKSIPQKAWIFNKNTNAHWKVSPFWPLKFDYLIVALDENYEWTAIGVPDQKYLWIMARDWKNPELIIEKAITQLKSQGYNTDNLIRVPHKR